MVVAGYILIIVLNSSGSFNEIQSTWQGGPEEETPVSSWIDSFYSSEYMNWFSTEGSLTLDYAEDIPEHIIDADAGAPYSVVAVNMDSDTDIDLLVTSWSDDLVAWYRNNGNGDSWTLVEIASEFDGANCARPFDVNSDGYMDVIATAFYDDSLYWFESDSSEYLWRSTASADASQIIARSDRQTSWRTRLTSELLLDAQRPRRPARTSASASAEDTAEQVIDTEHTENVIEVHPREVVHTHPAKSLMAVLVIPLPLLRIAQNLIGLSTLLELRFRLFIVGVYIRMVFSRKFAKGFFYFRIA